MSDGDIFNPRAWAALLVLTSAWITAFIIWVYFTQPAINIGFWFFMLIVAAVSYLWTAQIVSEVLPGQVNRHE